MTLHLSDRMGVRIAADYEHVWYQGGTTNGVRLLMGGVWAIKR